MRYTTFFLMARQNLKIKTTDKSFTVTISTQNDITTDVVFVRAKARFRPTFQKSDYSKIIAPIKKEFVGAINRIMKASDVYMDRTLCDIDFSEGSPSVRKWSYVKYSVYAKSSGVINHLADHAVAMRPIVDTLNRIIRNGFESVGFEMKECEND